MHLPGYNPSGLPGSHAGTAVSRTPHTGEHTQEHTRTGNLIISKFASAADLPPPPRWGLNE